MLNGLHGSPIFGEGRDVVSKLLDYVFPETIQPDNSTERSQVKQGQSVSGMVNGGVRSVGQRSFRSKETKVGSGLRICIKGAVTGVGFRKWISSRARSLGLTGWVRNRGAREIEVVVVGSEGAVSKLVALVHQGPKRAVVEKVFSERYFGETPNQFRLRKKVNAWQIRYLPRNVIRRIYLFFKRS